MTQRKTTPRALRVRERQDQALHLRRAGHGWQQIATQLGYASPGAAYEAANTSMSRIPSEDAKAVRDLELARLDQLTVELWDLYLRDTPVVSNGKVIDEVVDLGPKLAALGQLRLVGESRRKLVGADAPTRKIVEVVSAETVEAEIARLEAELAGNDRDVAR